MQNNVKSLKGIETVRETLVPGVESAQNNVKSLKGVNGQLK